MEAVAESVGFRINQYEKDKPKGLFFFFILCSFVLEGNLPILLLNSLPKVTASFCTSSPFLNCEIILAEMQSRQIGNITKYMCVYM